MYLPPAFLEALEPLRSDFSEKKQRKFVEVLTKDYKYQGFRDALKGKEQLEAYLSTRAPATYAANMHVFKEISRRVSPTSVRSFLDLGAGPGIGIWAAKEIFSSIEEAALLEKNAQWIAMGSELVKPLGIKVDWLQQDLTCLGEEIAPFDLVLMSYSLGEISEKATGAFFEALWKKVEKLLVLIEPGTPRGFSQIRKAREALIALGGNLIAPCPHREKCPIAEGDWCHFSQRLSRSSQHRKLKSGTLGYEDEKFSYLVLARNERIFKPVQGRILRHPKKGSGHLTLDVCSSQGTIQQRVVSRKEGETYLKARKALWGDAID